MAISSELSSEIAAALLATKKSSPRELDELKELVLRIHSELQRMTADESSVGPTTSDPDHKDLRVSPK